MSGKVVFLGLSVKVIAVVIGGVFLVVSILLLSVWLLGAHYGVHQELSREVVPVRGDVSTSSPVTVYPDELSSAVATHTMWFVGDVMLSRHVGQLALRHGVDYSWSQVAHIPDPGNLFVINFEACFSNKSHFSYEQSMSFPVKPDLLAGLVGARVTHASLANNHGLDCGFDDYEFTKQHLATGGIVAFGHPTQVGEDSVATTTLGEYRVGILALHTLFVDPDEVKLKSAIESLASATDIQIVYVHWGNEYEEISSSKQRSLAETLANLGIDLIIGHHPHVVQEIAQVGDTMVVYSLGNFIFDQYFSIPVQQGLVVGLETSRDNLRLRLYPVTSEGHPAQPRLMQRDEAGEWLRVLATRSDQRLAEAITAGYIDLPLAKLTNSTIIAP